MVLSVLWRKKKGINLFAQFGALSAIAGNKGNQTTDGMKPARKEEAANNTQGDASEEEDDEMVIVTSASKGIVVEMGSIIKMDPLFAARNVQHGQHLHRQHLQWQRNPDQPAKAETVEEKAAENGETNL